MISKLNICKYANDNTLHTCDLQLDKLMEKLEGAAENALCWFRDNGMKMNSEMRFVDFWS